MKNICSIIIILGFYLPTYPQSTFDQSINEVSNEISQKLNLRNKKKIAVLYITDINKNQTVTGKYIADLISVNLVNNSANFEVFDRENLSNIVDIKKLIADGFIDAAKAKEIGDILAVESIITGNYTVLPNTLKLSIKALDVNGGFIIAAAIKEVQLTSDVCSLLGINSPDNSNNSGRRGFNSPVHSNEILNNPGTVNKECEQNKTGNYCFTNSTEITLEVSIFVGSTMKMTLQPGQTQCFYDLPARAFNYKIIEKDFRSQLVYRAGSQMEWTKPKYEMDGQIEVEKCKSKSYIIK